MSDRRSEGVTEASRVPAAHAREAASAMLDEAKRKSQSFDLSALHQTYAHATHVITGYYARRITEDHLHMLGPKDPKKQATMLRTNLDKIEEATRSSKTLVDGLVAGAVLTQDEAMVSRPSEACDREATARVAHALRNLIRNSSPSITLREGRFKRTNFRPGSMAWCIVCLGCAGFCSSSSGLTQSRCSSRSCPRRCSRSNRQGTCQAYRTARSCMVEGS